MCICLCAQNFKCTCVCYLWKDKIERKKKKCKGKGNGRNLSLSIQYGLTKENLSDIFSVFTSLLFDIDSNANEKTKWAESASSITPPLSS
jgi:hypothetical protein